MISKTRLDRAGKALARGIYRSDDEYLEADEILDSHRQAHLAPLTETSSEIQTWLSDFTESYYLAQRLKRKPQILRKLSRLSVRLSQLQDIGGLRIIVPKNRDVDELLRFVQGRVDAGSSFRIDRVTDYRERGRDLTGYRSLHLILARSGHKLELQLRSRVQHYWSESIERTSVIYGHVLKEEEGDPKVLEYFKTLSEAFFEIEAAREPTPALRIKIDELHAAAQEVILADPAHNALNSTPDESAVFAMMAKARGQASGISNWIIVFNWSFGTFVHWEPVPRDAAAAVMAYVDHERRFRAEEGFEVVLVGASEIETLRETHGHYFGVGTFDSILQNLDTSVRGISARMELGLDERKILSILHRKHKWGAGRVSRDTIRNHYCQGISDIDTPLDHLIKMELVTDRSGISLNQSKKGEIEKLL